MKYLFTVQNYKPQVSGVPMIVSGIAEELVKRGHFVSVVTRSLERQKKEEVINGVNVYRFSIFHKKFFGIVGEVDNYKNFVKNFDAEVVVLECSQCETTDLLLGELKNYKNKKVVFHSHGFSGLLLKPFARTSNLKSFLGNLYNFIRFSIYYKTKFKVALRDFDKIIVLSKTESSFKYLDENFKGEISIIPNFCDEIFIKNEQTFDLNHYGITRDYMINIANFEEVKDQKRLLKEFYLSRASKNVDLVLIGSKKNNYYKDLTRLKVFCDKEFGRKEVFFLTGVERSQLPFLLKNATCFLLTSKIEAFSVSLIESLMCGTPFVSTEVGSVKSLIGGFVAGPNDNFHELIDKAWELHLNGELKKLGQDGAEFAENNLRLKGVVDKFEEVVAES